MTEFVTVNPPYVDFLLSSVMLTSFYRVSSAVMELWQKSFLLEEDDDELKMANCMVFHQPKHPVYHGRFNKEDFCESEFLANFRFTRTLKKEKQTTPFIFGSVKIKLNKTYRI